MGKKNRDEILENDINSKISRILNDKFGLIDISAINKYSNFLTFERLVDINEYNSYGLTSPQIYNLIYKFLTLELNYNKHHVLERLVDEANLNKYEMDKIKVNRWSISDYRSNIYEVDSKKNETKNNVESKTNLKKEDYYNSSSSYYYTIIDEDNNYMPIIEYRFCTNCGLPLDGQFPTVSGTRVLSNCNCNQMHEEIYLRKKNYCGKCGKFLTYHYCSYCGASNK